MTTPLQLIIFYVSTFFISIVGSWWMIRKEKIKLKQEQELDEIVKSLLEDVNKNYIREHNK